MKNTTYILIGATIKQQELVNVIQRDGKEVSLDKALLSRKPHYGMYTYFCAFKVFAILGMIKLVSYYFQG